MKKFTFAALTAFCLTSSAYAQCDMNDVSGCGPAKAEKPVNVEQEQVIVQCDMGDRSCGPAKTEEPSKPEQKQKTA